MDPVDGMLRNKSIRQLCGRIKPTLLETYTTAVVNPPTRFCHRKLPNAPCMSCLLNTIAVGPLPVRQTYEIWKRICISATCIKAAPGGLQHLFEVFFQAATHSADSCSRRCRHAWLCLCRNESGVLKGTHRWRPHHPWGFASPCQP